MKNNLFKSVGAIPLGFCMVLTAIGCMPFATVRAGSPIENPMGYMVMASENVELPSAISVYNLNTSYDSFTYDEDSSGPNNCVMVTEEDLNYDESGNLLGGWFQPFMGRLESGYDAWFCHLRLGKFFGMDQSAGYATGYVTIPLPQGYSYDAASSKMLLNSYYNSLLPDGEGYYGLMVEDTTVVTPSSYTDTTVTFPVKFGISSYEAQEPYYYTIGAEIAVEFCKKTATVSTISASDITVAKGKIQKISPNVIMSDGSNYTGTVTYKSANNKIATVDNDGNVKGVAGGNTTITVSADEKSTNITVKVADIALESTSFALQKSKSTKVEATLTNDSIKSVKSSNTKIAKVSVKKNVITVKAQNKTGTAKITVTTKQGITKTMTVKVQSDKVTTKSITANTKKVTLDKKGKKAIVDITINPVSSQDKVTITVKNTKIAKATYKDGKLTITAKKKGSTKVTVKSGKKSVNITVKVKK